MGEVQRLSALWPAAGQGFVSDFVQFTDRGRLAAEREPENAFAVLARLAPLVGDDAERALLNEAVLQIGRSLPHLLEHPAFGRYWRAELVRAGLGGAVAALELRGRLDVALPVAEAAGICARVIATTPGVEDTVAEALDAKGYLRDLPGLLDFLEQLDWQLSPSRPTIARGLRPGKARAEARGTGWQAWAKPGGRLPSLVVDNAVADLAGVASAIATVAEFLEEESEPACGRRCGKPAAPR